MSKSHLPLVLGGVLVVAAAGATAYVAAGLAHTSASDRAPAAQDARLEQRLLDRLDEIDRRLDNLQNSVRVNEQRAETALGIATALRDRAPSVAALGPAQEDAPRAQGPETVEGPVVVTSPPRAQTPEEEDEERARRLEGRLERAREQMRPFLGRLARARVATLGDPSPEAAEVRRAQVYADALAVRNHFRLSVDAEQRVRELLMREMESGVREVGPLVRGGFDNIQDWSTVLARLKGIWEETDVGVRELVTEEDFRAWREHSAAMRAAITEALEAKAR
jgi:hypothetical protein